MKILNLPSEYNEIKTIDLQKNTKLAILVNGLSLVLALAVFLIGLLIQPMSLNFQSPFFILIPMLIVYIVLHEFVHGVFFKKYSGEKAKYGFTGLYAFAKSSAYYNKREYIMISLSPIVILGVILLILNIVLNTAWFWWIFIIQIVNISGAAGDLYVTFVMGKMPADILIKDDGVSMTIYEKQVDSSKSNFT